MPAHSRPFWAGLLVNVVIVYSLYFLALAQGEPPTWAVEYIELLKPIVKALNTAARISHHPFPAQVMILYAAVSAVLLSVYFVYCAFFVKHIREELCRRFSEWMQQFDGGTARQRLKFAGTGVFFILVTPLWPLILMILSSENIGWREVGLFSPSIGSSTILLLMPIHTAVSCVLGQWFIYVSMRSCKPSTLNEVTRWSGVKSFMPVASGAICITTLVACVPVAWPTAPVDDFSILPDNVFSASVRKHVRSGLPVDLSKIEEDFMVAFDHEEIEAVVKAFQTNGGSCVLPEERNAGLVTCKIAFQWKTTTLVPQSSGASAVGFAYQIVTAGNRVSRVNVQVYPTPLK
jgi:hypothetical protein